MKTFYPEDTDNEFSAFWLNDTNLKTNDKDNLQTDKTVTEAEESLKRDFVPEA